MVRPGMSRLRHRNGLAGSMSSGVIIKPGWHYVTGRAVDGRQPPVLGRWYARLRFSRCIAPHKGTIISPGGFINLREKLRALSPPLRNVNEE